MNAGKAPAAPRRAGAEDDNLRTRSSLLARLCDLGDSESWREFFETYWQLIFHVARKSGLSDADAQEIVQDTVIAVAHKMPEFRYDPAKGSFKQWLLLITRRRIQDRLRQIYRLERLTRSDRSSLAVGKTIPPDTMPSPDVLIEEAWEEEWREYVFQAALNRVRQQVNPKQFQVFDLCVLQNLEPARVARMLGLTAARVYLAKHRVSSAIKRAAAEIDGGRDRDAKG